MSRSTRSAVHSLATVASAIVFVLLLDAAITRTNLLWGPTAFENSLDSGLAFGQLYKTAREIYHRRDDGATRVALLGNSRIWFGGREGPVAEALEAADASRRFRVDNLSLFGGGPLALNMVWRHARRELPDVLVLTLDPTDLLIPMTDPATAVARKTLNLGLVDPAGDPDAKAWRLDRWLRTAWRLYRFREFARAALAERLVRRSPTDPFPDFFESRTAFFQEIRPDSAPEMIERYAAWQASPDLDRFLRFLEAGQQDHLRVMQARSRRGVVAADLRDNLSAIEQLLSQVSESGVRALVLMMPENPLLEEDEGEFHVVGFSDPGTQQIRELAMGQGLGFVDGRRWLGAESFLDLDHLLPSLSGFEPLLADAVIAALNEAD